MAQYILLFWLFSIYYTNKICIALLSATLPPFSISFSARNYLCPTASIRTIDMYHEQRLSAA